VKKLMAVDDLDGNTPADVTVALGIDGEWRELDLTADNWTLLAGKIKEYWDAGRKMAKPPARPPAYRHKVRHGMSAHEYWRRFREWADANGVRYTSGAGKVYYPRKAQERFEQYLSEKEKAG
jgi:Lsr2